MFWGNLITNGSTWAETLCRGLFPSSGRVLSPASPLPLRVLPFVHTVRCQLEYLPERQRCSSHGEEAALAIELAAHFCPLGAKIVPGGVKEVGFEIDKSVFMVLGAGRGSIHR